MTVVLFPIYILISLNTKKKNEYLPFVWLDDTDENAEAFGLQSYVGRGQQGSDHEAIASIYHF